MKLLFKCLLVAGFLHSANAIATCSPNMSVSSELQLNTAIECFNTGTADQTISLNFGFRATDTLEAIEPANPYTLTIEGNRKRIRSVHSVGNLFEVRNASLVINDLILLNTSGSAIEVSGDAELEVYGSSITGGELGVSVVSERARADLFNSLILDTNTYGIRLVSGSINLYDSTVKGSDRSGIFSSSGDLSISNSTITGGRYGGVYVGGGSATIKDSTIAGNRLNGVDIAGGEVLISNSTVSDNRIGIYAGNGSTSVGNSTIAYNRDNGLEAGGGNLKVYSSLVTFNAQGGPYSDCLQFSGSLLFVGPAGSSFNSDGSCRSFNLVNAVSSITMEPSDLLGHGDYGCASKHRTPTGNSCVQISPLSESSIAIGKGACRGIGGTPAIPNVVSDQINQARPVRCSAGAAEFVGKPAAVKVISPVDRVDDSSPMIQWSEEVNSSAHKYRIIIRDSLNEIILNKVLPLSAFTKTGAVYSYGTGMDFDPGIYRVWVIAISSEGRSSNSPRSRFIITDASLPGKVSILSPDGVTSENSPLFEWSDDTGSDEARAYRVVVRDSTNTVLLNRAIMLSELTKSGSVLSYNTGMNFLPGVYRVWVRGVNFAGIGPNSTRSTFRILD